LTTLTWLTRGADDVCWVAAIATRWIESIGRRYAVQKNESGGGGRAVENFAITVVDEERKWAVVGTYTGTKHQTNAQRRTKQNKNYNKARSASGLPHIPHPKASTFLTIHCPNATAFVSTLPILPLSLIPALQALCPHPRSCLFFVILLLVPSSSLDWLFAA